MSMEFSMGSHGEIFEERKVYFESDVLKEAYEPKVGVHYRSPTGHRLLCVNKNGLEFMQMSISPLADRVFLSDLSDHMYKQFVKIEKNNNRWN